MEKLGWFPAARMRTHILSVVMPAHAGNQYAEASRLEHSRLWNTGLYGLRLS